MNPDDSNNTGGHGSSDQATPFHELENFVALPRVSGLAMNSGGSRLVTAVATLDPKRTGYTTALWEVDPSGERPAHRLTRSAEGESGAAFLATGDLLFTSARPGPGNGTDDAGKQASLWRLPEHGGEAELLHSRSGGISSVATAAHADTAVVVAEVLAGASGEAEDAERRTARKDAGVAAILHSGYPVRYWDADLGPGEPRYFRLDVDAEDEPLVSLAEGVGAGLRDSHPELSPDGTMLFTALRLPEALGSQRSALARIDVATGERTVLLNEAGFDAAPGPVSPDGRTVIVICNRRTSADTSPRIWLALLPVRGGELIPLAEDWDRWPAPAAWLPDGSGILVTADDDGAAPVFAIDTATGAVRRITADAAAYSDISVSPDGATAYGLRSSYLYPAEPVRIDLATGETTRLRGPAERPELPGTLERVETVGE
ncbi:TolB family protein, partial [Arthrobacter sp. H41]|uniref:TolB family protein n=1 Tax=Arthrobacter sp. H41 TaxID=1312978 RepID=UPI0040384C1B